MWNGTKTVEREAQGLTNKMGRASLRVRRTTPLWIVTAVSAHPPSTSTTRSQAGPIRVTVDGTP